MRNFTLVDVFGTFKACLALLPFMLALPGYYFWRKTAASENLADLEAHIFTTRLDRFGPGGFLGDSGARLIGKSASRPPGLGLRLLMR
jgi:hypothetical protein